VPHFVPIATTNGESAAPAQEAPPTIRLRPWQRYAIAIVITGLITALRFSLDPILSNHSIFTFYFASVILAAWYCGLGPSILSIVLAAVIASFSFAEPRGSFRVSEFRHQLGLVFFCIISGYMAYLIHWLKCDIARRQQVEADLHASQEQLQLHQNELAHMSRLSVMGEMAATLAHELNQPLHAAKNYARGSVRRLRKDPKHDAELMAVLEHIGEEADRAAEILRRVRDFVQKTGPHVSAVSVNDLIQDALTIVNLELKRTRARIVCEFAPGIAAVMADPIQIEQVVVNLARNGLESMHDVPVEQRVLCIGTRQCNEQTVEVFVRDRGKGISEQEMQRIFEPFFTTKAEGMGMGLAISRSIIHSHEGRLWVSPNDDCGCTFQFTLPVTQGAFPS
jgi:C4-dicarboxylate-specific signal transduction histidine kinase